MSEAKNTEVKGAQASAPAASSQGGENSQTNTPASTAAIPEPAQDGANPAAADNPATDSAKAPKESKSKKGKSGKFLVISPFADRDNFGKMWNVGDDVSMFEKERLDGCVKRGLVEEV